MKFVFYDWIDCLSQQSIYNTELGVSLSLCDFHSGTVFTADQIEKETEFIQWAKSKGAVPVFYVIIN